MEISKWHGLRNVNAPDRLKPGDMHTAVDVDVDDSGAVRTRLGQTLITVTASHSLWSKGSLALVVQGTDLKRMDENGVMTQLRRLTYGGPVSYAELNGVVYFSNGIDTGRVVNGAVKEWGVRRPLGQPSCAPTGGTLPPARYLYAMTFMRADGLESGAQVPAAIDLATQGGLLFSNMETSSDPDVLARVIYISGPNGTELYRAMTVSIAATVATYLNAGLDGTQALPAEPVEPAPPGTIVEIHSGVAYVVDGSVAWYSDQYSLERFRRASRFLQLPGQMNLFGAVDDGIFAATDTGTWFLAGTDPATLKARKILSYGAVPGTMVRFDAEQLNAEGEQAGSAIPALLWTSPNGVILGTTGGQVKNLTEENYSFPTAPRGAGMFRTVRGYSSYISVLQGAGAAPNEYR